ncbi:MAG: hypothetical protein KBD63_01390 [Bacteriovoracaceae bacterium]|nr:hypothetical protein [Bacteriovoracaceae bacterium]
MDLQTSIIKKYREVFPDHTLQKMSDLTTIHITRIFRLLNGYQMKLHEYEKFYQAIQEHLGQKEPLNEFKNISYQCEKHLSLKALNQISYHMKKYLHLNNLLQ